MTIDKTSKLSTQINKFALFFFLHVFEPACIFGSVPLKGTSHLRFESKITPRVLGTGEKNMISSLKKEVTIESIVVVTDAFSIPADCYLSCLLI